MMDDVADKYLPVLRKLENSADDAVSPKGAIGRYQVMPSTGAAFGYSPDDLKDPTKNEDAARKTVHDLVRRVGDNPDDVLVGYNASTKVLNKFRSVGRDLAALPAETKNYLSRGRELFASSAKPAEQVAAATPSPVAIPPQSSPPAPFEDKIAHAIAAGYSQDDIDQYTNQLKAKARAAGYSEADIASYFGTVADAPYPYATGNAILDYVGKEFYTAAKQNYDAIKKDWQTARSEDEAAQHSPTWWQAHEHIFYSFLADGKLPIDAFNLAMTPIQAALHATYVNPVAKGLQVLTPGLPTDQAQQQAADTLWGLGGEGGLPKLGKPATSAASFPELVAGRVAIATQKTGTAAAVANTEHITTNLLATSIRTGEDVASLTARAQNDPVLREQLAGKQPETPPEGSSHTPVKEDNPEIGEKAPGDFVIPKDETVFAPQTEPERQAALAKWEQAEPVNTLADAEASIDAHMAQPVRSRFSVRDTMERLYEQMFDDQAPWKRLIWAARDGKSLPSQFVTDPIVLQRLATGSKGRAAYSFTRAQVDEFGNIQGPSFEKIMEPIQKGAEFVRFERYITAVRDVNWQERGLESGLNPNATRMIAEDPSYAKYKPVLDNLVKWRNNELGMLQRAGFLAKDDVTRLVHEEPYPIPFHREIEGVRQKASAGGTPYQPIKVAEGSERRILGPVEQIMRESMIRHDLVAHNIANESVVSELANAGMAREHSVPMAIKLTPEEINDIAAKTGGQDVDGFDATIFRHFKFPLADDALPVFRNGRAVVYKFDDPEAAKALRGLGRQGPAIFTKIMAGIARVQRASIVLNPAFPLRQILYDIPFQFTITPGFRNSLGEFISGMYHGIAGTPMDDLYRRSGAWRPLFDDVGDKYIRNKVAENYKQVGLFSGIRNLVNSPIRALKAWSDLVYSAQRRGRFAAETKATQNWQGAVKDIGKKVYEEEFEKTKGDPDKAHEAAVTAMRSARQAQKDSVARDAMKATFHTDEKGSFSRDVNQVQLFFSAYMNMMKRLGEAFDPRDPAQAMQSMGKAVAVFTVPALMNYYAYKDEPWYKETPDMVKDMGLVFPPLHEGGYPVFIPQAPVLRLLFGAIPRRIAELHSGDGGFKNFFGDLAKELIPFQATYNAALPIIENIANYSFHRGEPLYSGPKTSAQYQYTQYTSPAAKAIARTLSDIPLLKNFEMTPWQIDNFIQGNGGPLIQQGINAVASTVLPPDQNPLPEKPFEENAWTGAFFRRYPSAQAASIQNFYETDKSFQTKHADIEKAMTDNNLPLFRQLVAQTPQAAQTAFRSKRVPGELPQYLELLQQNRQAGYAPSLQALRGVRKEMENLRDTEYKVIHESSTNMNPTEKRQLLDMIYGKMIVTAKLGSTILEGLGEQ